MSEFKNVSDITNIAYTIDRAYASVNKLKCGKDAYQPGNQTEAIVCKLPTDKSAVIDSSVKETGNAVSTLQVLTDAIVTIAEKLAKILEHARKTSGTDQSQELIEDWQTHVQNLAKEINQIVKSMEYNSKKLSDANGNSPSASNGKTFKTDIFIKDFCFDAQKLDITKDPQKTIPMVEQAITKLNDYKINIDNQQAYLADSISSIISDIEISMGLDMKGFQPEQAAPMADYTASLISQDKETALNTQSRLTPNEILKLLKV